MLLTTAEAWDGEKRPPAEASQMVTMTEFADADHRLGGDLAIAKGRGEADETSPLESLDGATVNIDDHVSGNLAESAC